ncbi:MAG TPA: flagellar basal body P-ring formation chaperone FlgA [Steroidobacteraceae bacterium]
MTRSNWYWLIAATLWVAAPMAAHAQSTQPIESIRAAAEKEVRALLPQSKAKHYVTASKLDPRLRLAACDAPLETFIQNNSAPATRSTIGVRCAAHAQWTIYVPVTVETETSILVLRRALARRSPVEPDDVELQTRRLPGVESGFINDLGNLRGRRLRRALPAGTPLTAEELVPEVLVRRGQQVTLLATNGAMEIRAQGHALTEGGASDRIRVQNVNSLKIVEGVVENAGTVRVPL